MSEYSGLIPTKHLSSTCKAGKGEACCRYIMSKDLNSYYCAKAEGNESMKMAIDERADFMTAKGDNCEGPPI